MLRRIYIRLLWWHPAAFRWRFGDEMLESFCHARDTHARLRLLADGVVSLARQWLLRPEFHEPFDASPAPVDGVRLPAFYTFEPYQPRPAALLQGGLIAIASILFAVFLINKGGNAVRPLLIGVYHSRLGLLPVSRDSITANGVNSQVKFGPDPVDPLETAARAYFTTNPVLRALDSDRDLILTRWEIDAAPEVLRRLDTNHDGKLSAEECGMLQRAGSTIPPQVLEQLRARFMRVNPVLDALDTDGNFEISAAEIANSPAALRTLDKNHDGSLTADEILPPYIVKRILEQRNRPRVVTRPWE